jgi:glycosyltransferase involved in cell wall biosynthesis
MRIAVNTIAKNELKNVARFVQNLDEADLVVVADTGSTDGTQDALRARGVTVHDLRIEPWRFDAGRNAALNLVPDNVDVVVSIDLDETITPGWRAAIENSWLPQTTRLRYPYVWSHNADGSAATTFHADKIHARRGYVWTRPVHEVLRLKGNEIISTCDGLRVDHYPDPTKSRSNYLPLLELAVHEDPQDDRSAHYLGREYMYVGRWDDAIAQLRRHLRLETATWKAERSASMRYIARCLAGKKDYQRAGSWLFRATIEAPDEREPWIDLAQLLFVLKDFDGAAWAGSKGLAVERGSMSYLNEAYAWSAEPHLLVASALWQTGELDAARDHVRRAGALVTDAGLHATFAAFERGGCNPAGLGELVKRWV